MKTKNRLINIYDTKTVRIESYLKNKLFSSWFVSPIRFEKGLMDFKNNKSYLFYCVERKGLYKFFYRLKYIRYLGIGKYFRTFVISKNLAWNLQCFGLTGTISRFFYFLNWHLSIFLKNFFLRNIYYPLFFCSIPTNVINLIKKIKSPTCMESNFRIVISFILWKTGIVKFVSFILRRKIKVSYHSDYIWITSEKI